MYITPVASGVSETPSAAWGVLYQLSGMCSLPWATNKRSEPQQPPAQQGHTPHSEDSPKPQHATSHFSAQNHGIPSHVGGEAASHLPPQVALQPYHLPVQVLNPKLHLKFHLIMCLPAWTSVHALCFFCKPQPSKGYLARSPHSTANPLRNANSQRREQPRPTMPKPSVLNTEGAQLEIFQMNFEAGK